ncbi:MAG: DMT family transporter [Chitinophagaceae bacterium]|nr:DMT family transporter [Chitinophagaceae bacterium]
MQKTDWKFFLWVSIVLIFWASSYVAIRYALETFSAENLAFLRYSAASIIFVIIGVINKSKLPAVKDLPGCILLGFLGFALYNLLLNYGERTVDAGTASFIINTVPFFSILFALLRRDEHISLIDWFSFIIAFAGVSIIIISKNTNLSFDYNALLILGAAVCQALYFVLQKSFLKRYSPLEITSYAVWFGTAILFFFSHNSYNDMQAANWKHIASVIYLGVFPGAVAYVLMAVILNKYKVSSVAGYLFLIPFITLLMSFIMLKEIPSLLALGGGALIVIGLLIKNGILLKKYYK